MAQGTVTDYKNNLVKKILSDDIIVKALHYSTPNFISLALPADKTTLTNKNIFPYKHVPGIQEEAETFITMSFRFEWDGANKRTLRDMSMFIYIFTHQRLQKTDYEAIRTDMIADRIEALLQATFCFGVNRVLLKSRYEYNMAESEYSGCVLQFDAVNLVAKRK